MNHQKTNRSLWYSLGLAVLLCAAALVVSTGTTFARYRTEREKTLTFHARPAAELRIGVLKAATEEAVATLGAGQSSNEVFDPNSQPEWEILGDMHQLNFAIANGISDTEYSQRDQKVILRLVGTLGLWTGEEAVDIYLRIPSETAQEGYEELQAAVSPIEQGTALYTTHGAGWIYTFQKTEEEELSWILPGGELSCISLTVVMKDAAPSNPSLLQPLVIGDLIAE